MLPPPPPEPTDSTPPESFPEAWRDFLKSNVFHYQLLNSAERKRLRSDASTFIAGKHWEGCRGLSVTDEMKVTIAAQACLMLLGREHDCFGRVRSILVYPSPFRVEDERWQEEGWAPMDADGQAMNAGPVILAWDLVLAEGRDPSGGSNLVIHEFAHQLDLRDGYGDGTLDLPGEQGERWQEVLAADYDWLVREIRHGRETYLGDEAAANKSEFFATASERFFTQPAQLRHYHPQLYQMLKVVYALNPAKWFAGKK
jgi:Mlc titration factor MtfA (ptsG expression regulator)